MDEVRILDEQEFQAIRDIQSKWGYSRNSAFADGLAKLAENPTNDPDTAIEYFLDEWGIREDAVGVDIQNLLRMHTQIRVDRHFLVRHGLLVLKHHIVDLPEKWDDPDNAHMHNIPGFYRAADGTITMVTMTAYMSHRDAYWDASDQAYEAGKLARTLHERHNAVIYDWADEYNYSDIPAAS